MRKNIFIAATGTEVGKTFISALILSTLRKKGINAGYYKPVISGTDTEPNDCEYVCRVAGLDCPPETTASYMFKEPLSPHLAANRADVTIKIEKIIDDFKNKSQKYDFLLVEGCGGIACPIFETEHNTLMLTDIINALSLDTIIICPSGLGAVNAIITTVSHAITKGVNVIGIIMNKYEKDNFLHNDNKRIIEKLTKLPVVALVEEGCKDMDLGVIYE